MEKLTNTTDHQIAYSECYVQLKNLENKEILSDEILNAISLIIKQTPNVVFSGSIALTALNI